MTRGIGTLFEEYTAAEAVLEAVRVKLVAALTADQPEADPNPVELSYTVPSRSRPGTEHTVTKRRFGSRVCSCESFSFRGWCRHIN